MTDYDLGKARGRIVIEHDERGFRRAEGANERLAESVQRVAEGFVDAEKAQEDYNKQVKKTERAESDLKQKQSEAQKALNRLNEAQSVANRLKEEGKTKTERYKQAVEAAQKAQNRYSEAVSEAASAESKLNDEVEKVNRSFKNLQRALSQDQSINSTTKQVTALNNSLAQTNKTKVKVKVDSDDALNRMRTLRKEHDGLLRALSIPAKMGLKAGAIGGIGSGIGALGGLAGLGVGGLTGFGVNGIMATVQGLGQLSGLAGLLPVVFGNLAATITTIGIATDGMGDAFSAVAANDAKAFGEALKKLSTSGQEVAIAFNTIYPAIEEFKKAVQEEFFKGIAKEMKELSATYMPMLKDAFQSFAQLINWTMRDLADWAKQTGVIADVQTILDNLKTTMGVLAPTARMLADAFLDIMKVSSDFGPELASSFQSMAAEFRDFIQTAREDGSLAQWIRTGIESFKSLLRSIGQFTSAFGTIFEIQNKYSGGFFGFIERIATAFNAWTKSAEGNAALNEFFRSITELSVALTPVLTSLANIILGQIIPMFADFGAAIQPGILEFLRGFSYALEALTPALNQMAGPMNELLTVLGQAMADIMTEVAKELPTLFRLFVEAIKELAPNLPEITRNLMELGKQFMLYLPLMAKNIGEILPWLIKFADIALRLATLLTSATIQIVKSIGDLFKSMDDFGRWVKDVFQRTGQALADGWSWLGEKLKEIFGKVKEAMANGWSNLFEKLGDLKNQFWDWLKELPSKALEAGRAIVTDIIKGITEKLGPLGKVAREIAEAVSDYLPSSPAKKGPFSGQGWARPRGEKLAQDFAAGINAGSNEAQYAGGNLSKATESGIKQFVSDMLELSGFGQRLTALFGDIASNFFNIAKIATTNPITGESVFPKKWVRTATDDELRRKREDKAFQERLDAEEERRRKEEEEALKRARQLRPETTSPAPAGAPELPDPDLPLRPPPGAGPLRTLLSNAPEGAVRPNGGYMGDEALLSRIQAGSYVSLPGVGDLTEGIGDCTSSIEDLVAIIDGQPTGGRSMATGNAEEWLTSKGFLPTDVPMPGTFQVGFFNDPNAPGGGHMQATLPGGTKFNWGSNAMAANKGVGDQGAWEDPRFNRFYYRPVGAMSNVLPRSPAAPDRQYEDGRRINRMEDPNAQNPSGALPPAEKPAEEFIRMSEALDSIDNATQEQLSQQDVMINELRAQNPLLDAAIKRAQDPSSTDQQVGSALDQISQIADDQRRMDNAQSRYVAEGLDSLTSGIAGDRGMSQMQQDPIQVMEQVVSGAMGLIADGFKVFDASMKSIESASNISSTLVRGIENTEDIYNIIEEMQSFIELAGAISQTVSDGLALAGVIATAAGGGQDGGATGAALQAASAVAGIVTSVIQTINAAIDLGQEAYQIATKYLGKALSYIVGGGNGSLMGDIQFLLDQNTMELKTWSGDNPQDKRAFAVPNMLQFGDQPGDVQQGKIRDLNMYIGPGTDPNEAMNAAMWSIKTDQNGVFTGGY